MSHAAGRGRPSVARRTAGPLVALALVASSAAAQTAETASPDWVSIDYGAILDGRRLSHSGESVAVLLQRLAGRTLPAGPERPEDRALHGLLDPLLEPYAFVLPDALDTLIAPRGAPLVEVGSLWHPGDGQPAWVELLRARRYLVESDGLGRMRLFLPVESASEALDGARASRSAWQAARPVLRQVMAAEIRRTGVTPLRVEIHGYQHRPERSSFRLAVAGASLEVEDTAPDGFRPPFDLDSLEAFLDAGLQLEGARLERSGSLRWLGSRVRPSPTLLGRFVTAADFAVAYRAVFHGGLSEPYMSLDRGLAPQTSIVNYGGRLRDTALGQVSLLCDIRFKTFSEGIDIASGRDLRRSLREVIPGFRTHLERLAYDPGSAGMAGQQTRLWFYPDDVDLTLSTEGDVLVLRRVRMSAASERFEAGRPGAGGEADPPWTTATVAAINRDYDRLIAFFPELADLDQVVRLLSLFTWLRRVQAEGALVPELDTLLALELPSLATPRLFPQLLAFNALPPLGSDAPVEVYERVGVAEALDRLAPLWGPPLPARRRYERALRALDPANPEQAALLQELARLDPEAVEDSYLDLAAHRAERLRMHQLVLSTLAPQRRVAVAERFRRGEQLRVFSVGIGGLDLGMEQVLSRAVGRRLELSSGGFTPGDAAADTTQGPRRAADVTAAREAWRRDPALGSPSLPDHGLGDPLAAPGASRSVGDHLVELGPSTGGRRPRPSWILTVNGRSGPEPRARRLRLDARGTVSSVERLEGGRSIRYQLERAADRLVAKPLEPVTDSVAADPGEADPAGPLPQGLILLRVERDEGEVESPDVRLRIEAPLGNSRRALEAGFPRAALQRLVLGRAVDRTPDLPLSGLAPLPPPLAASETLMVMNEAGESVPPWEDPPVPVPGEESPARLARALSDWWSADPDQPWRAVVGVDEGASLLRWASAPRPGSDALLLLPQDAFPGARELRDELAGAWDADRVVESIPPSTAARLVVFVSAEPAGTCGMRLRDVADSPKLQGKLLAAWCLAGDVRPDLPGALLGAGQLAGLSLAEATVVERRRAVEHLAALSAALAAWSKRPEHLPGPFLWYY